MTVANPDALEGALLDGRYRVGARIATGGMSTVYRGIDERLSRPVAVKVMDSRYAGDQQFLARFQFEARAVAGLKDPGLVAVYDQGLGAPGDARPFLVMELVDGGTLRDLLNERGPMPPHAVVAVLRPVLGALAVAHRAGLIHRDIKPENVLISDDGAVKIVDFGLVRAVAGAGITSASVMLGTAAYLSPEQVRGERSSPAGDVYALGVLTYELLTGRTPFAGDSALAVAYQRLDHDVPPPSAAIDGVPPDFDDLVARATARNPADRYADAVEMGDAVDDIADRLDLPPFRVPTPHASAQHTAATRQHAPTGGPVAPHRTLQLTDARDLPGDPGRDRRPDVGPGEPDFHGGFDDGGFDDGGFDDGGFDDGGFDDGGFDDDDSGALDALDPDTSGLAVTGRFAGIELSEFVLARQHERRMVLIWLAALFAVTGLTATAAWTVGNNLSGLLPL